MSCWDLASSLPIESMTGVSVAQKERNMLRFIRLCGIAAASLLMTVPAHANPSLKFTFSGLSNNEQGLNYFWGGYGGMGSGPGPNYQINFSPNAVIVSGAKGNLLTGTGTMVMNIHTEFANSFKLGYVALVPEVVDVWSDYNGTGSLLATMTLMPNGWCHSLTKCGFAHAGEPFPGAAASVTFSGAGGDFGIGSIELGAPYRGKSAAAVATPEPSSIVLLPTGVFGLIWIYIRRKRPTASAFAWERSYLSQ